MKHVLITGGSDGLGRITAAKLQQADFIVTILAMEEVKMKTVARELKCGYVVADVSDAAQVKTAVRRAEQAGGPIDIVINNAGVWLQGPLDATDDAAVRRVMDVNALGVINTTKAVVPGMKTRRSGRIINVISQAGLYGKAERAVYNASKWALTGFTKSMQMELKPSNISVVGFYPGAMNTQLFAKAGDFKDRSKALDPSIAAGALVFVCNLPNDVDVPEFGIQSLNY